VATRIPRLMRIRRRDKTPTPFPTGQRQSPAPSDRPTSTDPVKRLIAEPEQAANGTPATSPPEADVQPAEPLAAPSEPAPAAAATVSTPMAEEPESAAPELVEEAQEPGSEQGAARDEFLPEDGVRAPDPVETHGAKAAMATKQKAAKAAKAGGQAQGDEPNMRPPSIRDDATELLNGSKPAARELPRVMAIANQKGGVGKTTTTVNLGAALAEQDYRVLVVDLDPQANATTGLGVEARNFELSMYDVIMRDQPLEDCIEPTSVKNLFVAPATIDLAGVEIELVPAFSRELKLRRAIETIVDDFDFVLIDCPPSLGLITVNGLAAAHEVLVPIQCEYYALEGLSQLLRNVNLVSTNLNETLEVTTIVLTMYDARTRLSVDVANEVREHFSERVCRVVIPRTVRLSEAPSFGQPITVFDPASRGAVAYRELAKEVSNGAPQRTR
jgi:chromosome partitioning protein